MSSAKRYLANKCACFLGCVQEFVDSSIEFILFLLSAPIASLVSLFSLETKPSLLEGTFEIHKLPRKICLMIFQTWFN